MTNGTKRVLLGLAILLVAVVPVLASSAGFTIKGLDINVGKMEEGVVENGKEMPPRIQVKAVVGKPFTLVAQGMAYPRPVRGQAPKDPEQAVGSPTEPDEGKWTFDAVPSRSRITTRRASTRR